MKINFRSIRVGILLTALLVTSVLVLRQHRQVPATKVPAAPVAAVPFAPLAKVKGPDNAPVKIVEYSDFECPSCRVVQEYVTELFKNYPGQIQLTFRHFPLTSHKWSAYAHQAAECMNLQGKFWPYHDILYGKQNQWSVALTPPLEFLTQSAQGLGANMDLFAGCMADVAVTREIYAEKETGTVVQVNATPTFFIGEERFVGPKEVKERMENAIRKIVGLPAKPVVVEPSTPAPAAPLAQVAAIPSAAGEKKP
ncbi:MAG TPA: thioredoxin domain-containing protein [Candidatus Omnitrophota bacterium]|nr:thioredoxin domain-containing protein [Candidatus Omnitrophota bacterium]HPS37397.1 thioredoxin domain-containing protein [Candidatus Omnitrophota bacterium]